MQVSLSDLGNNAEAASPHLLHHYRVAGSLYNPAVDLSVGLKPPFFFSKLAISPVHYSSIWPEVTLNAHLQDSELLYSKS